MKTTYFRDFFNTLKINSRKLYLIFKLTKTKQLNNVYV